MFGNTWEMLRAGVVTAKTDPVTGGKVFSAGGLAAVGAARVSLRDWNGYNNTGSNDMGPIIQQAVTQLETAGNGILNIEHGTFACANSIVVRGGAPTLNNGYQGGIEISGAHNVGTQLLFSSGSGFVVDVGVAPTHGTNSSMAMVTLANMHIKGPSKSVSGSVGIDVGPQGNYQSTPNAIYFNRLWLDGFENLSRFDDTTNLWVMYCYFLNYAKALRFGFNQDTMAVMFNRFGDNQTVLGSQTDVAMAWDYISPRFSGATNLAGSQNHRIGNNWFMRQALVADIWDTTASNITFDHNQIESCTHYAQLGNSSQTTAPNRVVFNQNTFMRVDGQEETQAKFRFMNDAAAGSLRLTKNTCDTATGPKYGWVRCGTGSVVEFDDNSLPVAGGYVIEPNHLVVGASGKKIVLGSSEKYTFRTTTGSKEIKQFNASGNDNSPCEEMWAYNATDATIYMRYGNKTAGSDAASGNYFDVVQRSVSGTRYALGFGGVLPLQGSALPTAAASLRGMFFLVQGADGVADTLHICAKNAANAYVWRQVTVP